MGTDARSVVDSHLRVKGLARPARGGRLGDAGGGLGQHQCGGDRHRGESGRPDTLESEEEYIMRHSQFHSPRPRSPRLPFPAGAGAAEGNQDRRDLRLHRRRSPPAVRRPRRLGTKIAIDMINEKGGVEGYKINADLRRRAVQDRRRDQRDDAAARPGKGRPDHGRVLQRAVRADGAAGRRREEVHVGQRLRRLRACSRTRSSPTCSAPQVHSDQYGETSCTFLNENAKAKLGMDPKDLKVAIIYEDGPYGAGVGGGQRSRSARRSASRSC